MIPNSSYKILLVGESKVGKTTFIQKHLTREYIQDYNPTVGIESHLLKFNTNYGLATLNIHECGGHKKFVGLPINYYQHSDAVIVMFDLTSLETYKLAKERVHNILLAMPKLPLVLCGNKVDLRDRQLKLEEIDVHLKSKSGRKILYYDISVKSNYNFQKPLLFLLRQITNQSDLTIEYL